MKLYRDMPKPDPAVPPSILKALDDLERIHLHNTALAFAIGVALGVSLAMFIAM